MASPRPIPPATKIGTSFKTGIISCAKTEVVTGPICPPASCPSITKASTPMRTNRRAKASAGAKHIILIPAFLTALIDSALGSPPAKIIWLTRC